MIEKRQNIRTFALKMAQYFYGGADIKPITY